MLACTTVLSACQPAFLPRPSDASGLEVVKIGATERDPTASAQELGPDICTPWSLDAGEAERFFVLSETIDGRGFHHEYDTAPCRISGMLVQDGKPWRFSINGAAKAQLVHGEEVRYVGCADPLCAPLVLWEFGGLAP